MSMSLPYPPGYQQEVQFKDCIKGNMGRPMHKLPNTLKHGLPTCSSNPRDHHVCFELGLSVLRAPRTPIR
jgi:hypothetical protein